MWQRAIGPLVLLVAFVGPLVIIFGAELLNEPFFVVDPEDHVDLGAAAVISILLVAGGTLALIGGTGGYAIVVATRALTFRFDVPVWKGANSRLSLANFVIPLIWQGGLVCLVMALTMPILLAFGVTVGWGVFISLLIGLVPGQFILSWVDPWAPIQRKIIQNRMAARVLTAPEGSASYFAGLSDADGPPWWNKGRYIEQDVGVLTLEPQQLRYTADQPDRDLLIPANRIQSIVRAPDVKDTVSFVGGRHIILHWEDENGAPQAVRLHACGGSWTELSVARALDRLADAITTWHAQAITLSETEQQSTEQASPLAAG